MFDTHTHLNFKIFDGEADEIIKKTLASGISLIIVGTDFESSKLAVELARKYSGVWAAVGLHPTSIKHGDWRSEIQKIRELLKEKKVVAVGEIGLDFSHLRGDPASGGDSSEVDEVQLIIFNFFLDIAKENNLPVLLHAREATEKMLEILQSRKSELAGKFVWHCFCEDLKIAEKVIELGGLVSFTGMITFHNNPALHLRGDPAKGGGSWEVKAVIKKIPLEKIMLETDSPYLSPEPFRGKRNEPKNVVEIAKKIAEFKNISVEEVEKTTDRTAKKFFNI